MEFITENVSALGTKLGVAPEVLTKFLTDASASEEVKPFADSLGTLEIFKPDQLTQRITNERAQAATEATNTTKGNTYGAMDKRILDDTGIAKNAGELTIDYMARAAKEKYGTKTSESDEMKRLRDDLTAARTLLTEKDTELQTAKVQYATEAKQSAINAKLDAAINALPIQAEAELLDAQREFVKFRLLQTYDLDVVDGKVQFTDKVTKEVKRDPKTAAPMTEAALISEFAPKVVSLKKSSAAQPSGFTSGATTLTGAAANVDFSVYPSKEAFTADLKKQGIAPGGKEGGVLYAAFMKARPELFK